MDETVGVARIAIGGLMLMTGVMKLVVPNLRAAFAGQLRLAKLPLEKATFLLLPVAEVVVGTVLVLGVLTRPAALVVLAMMIGAGYVHLVVNDPSVFPLQPEAPIIPGVVIAISIFVLIGGSGSWAV